MFIYKLLKNLKIIGILIRLLKILPFKILKKSHNESVLLFYHTVTENHIPTKYLFDNPDKKKFKNDMYFMLKEYKSVSLKNIIDSDNVDSSILRDSFHLTFDDGFADNYEIAMNFLRKNKIEATFFIVKDFLDNKNLFYRNKASLIINKLNIAKNMKFHSIVKDYLISNNLYIKSSVQSLLKIKYKNKIHLDEIAKLCLINFDEYLHTKKPYMSTNQINDLISCGFSIGAHSIDHRLLQELDEKDQIYQVSNSMKFIQNKFGLDYKAFAAPFNDRNLKKSLIEYLLKENIIDVFFGTQGFRKDTTSKSYPRLSMDSINANIDIKKVLKNSLSVASILKPMNDFNVLR
jgi:peptidoglycan/xylan/chitin deacetylase (PgdA/CDA1 family)